MKEKNVNSQDWFQSALGEYLLEWEQAQLDEAVTDIFGYHALQLGTPELQALRVNRMPHRWLATPHPVIVDLYADFIALPFPDNSIDLLILPHALEFSTDPHTTLREAERVLVPGGKMVICGLNPASLWGWRQRRTRWYQRFHWSRIFLPRWKRLIGYWRLRDWLRLLNLEVGMVRFGCYRPAFESEKWLQRTAWLDPIGARWWPICGAAYFVIATKRIPGMRLLGVPWTVRPKRKPMTAPAAQQSHMRTTE
jgi:SAM-dependent methyltransferase